MTEMNFYLCKTNHHIITIIKIYLTNSLTEFSLRADHLVSVSRAEKGLEKFEAGNHDGTGRRNLKKIISKYFPTLYKYHKIIKLFQNLKNINFVEHI